MPGIPPIPERYFRRPEPPPPYDFDQEKQVLKTEAIGGGSGFIPPLWLSQVDDTNVKVAFGTVNGITPTNVNSNISISSDATWNIYMDATLASSGIPSTVTITASTSAVPADTSTHAYRLIGQVVRAAGVITGVTPSMAWSQEFVACGRDEADPTTTPGTYYWVVS